MAIIIQMEVDASVVALSTTMAAEPTLHIEPVGVVGGVHHQSTPLLRTGNTEEPTADAGEDVRRTLAVDESVADVTQFAAERDGHLFWVDWAGEGLIPEALFPAGEPVVVASLSGYGGTWEYKLICRNRETVSALGEHWDDHDERITTQGIAWNEELGEGIVAGLTTPQAEALGFAYEDGYYEVPRDINLKDLADDLGISHQSLSERLRRGHEELVADHFAPGEEDDVRQGGADDTGDATAAEDG